MCDGEEEKVQTPAPHALAWISKKKALDVSVLSVPRDGASFYQNRALHTGSLQLKGRFFLRMNYLIKPTSAGR